LTENIRISKYLNQLTGRSYAAYQNRVVRIFLQTGHSYAAKKSTNGKTISSSVAATCLSNQQTVKQYEAA
jgi:hypothetical protein